MVTEGVNSTTQALCFQLLLVGYLIYGGVYWAHTIAVGLNRPKVFSKEFMAQFNEQHQEAFGRDAPLGGIPDDGNGYYADKLPYKDWFAFNNVQRAHINLLEGIGVHITLTFVTAIGNPLWAVISLYLFIIGRITYGCGYAKKGPAGRACGGRIAALGFLGALSGSIYTLATWNWSGEGMPRVIPHSPDSIPGVF